MNPSPFSGVQIADIGHAVQLAIAPVFLIAGIGALLNVMANRLGRVVDRARALERDITGYDETMRARAMAELVVLDRRMVLVHWAIYACVASALAICLVIGVLFVGDLADAAVGTIVAVLFITAMALIVAGLVLFLIETGIATRSSVRKCSSAKSNDRKAPRNGSQSRSGRGENGGFREPARSAPQYVSTGSAESRRLQPGMDGFATRFKANGG